MAFTATDWEKQLMDLRALTATTGVVHEAQLFQITNWGAIAFGFTKWTANVDIETQTVIFDLEKKKHPKTLAKFVAGLDRSIHWLFGPEWGLRVKEGTRVLYEGQRKRKSVNEQRKARVTGKGSN
jgi:hypothetical protein